MSLMFLAFALSLAALAFVFGYAVQSRAHAVEQELSEELAEAKEEIRLLQSENVRLFKILNSDIEDVLWVYDEEAGDICCISCHVLQDTVGGHDPNCPVMRVLDEAISILIQRVVEKEEA